MRNLKSQSYKQMSTWLRKESVGLGNRKPRMVTSTTRNELSFTNYIRNVSGTLVPKMS